MRVAAIPGLRRAHVRRLDSRVQRVGEHGSRVLRPPCAEETGVGLLTAREARIASGRLARDELLARFAPRAQGARAPRRARARDAAARDGPPIRRGEPAGRVGGRAPGPAVESCASRAAAGAHPSSRRRTRGGELPHGTARRTRRLLLRTESAAPRQARAHRATIGRSVDVLPALGAPGLPRACTLANALGREPTAASLSAAETRGEIARLLALWRSTAGPARHPAVDGKQRVIDAAVHAGATGGLHCSTTGVSSPPCRTAIVAPIR